MSLPFRTRNRWLIGGAAPASAAALAACALFATAAEPPKCVAPSETPRWPTVAPVFDAHCGTCHDSRKSTNRGALAVFDQSRYPFTTNRPDTLVTDLRHMFTSRGSIPDPDKCKVLAWLSAGAPDAEGNKPSFR